jgi:site-specific DNA-methyltransferase (adenine-specific)
MRSYHGAVIQPQRPNALYYGDNLDILRRYVADDSVDLVYLDPPFSASRHHNLLFPEVDGTPSVAQTAAFTRTWTWDGDAARRFRQALEAGGRVADALQALRLVVGESSTLAFLTSMAPRLLELHRVMKATASIYLHCDPTTSPYLRVLMDAVFARANFCNEIVWRYRRWPTFSRRFQRMHDVLLFYAKSGSSSRPFNALHGYEPLAPSTRLTFGTRRQHSHRRGGRRRAEVQDVDSTGPPLSDVWDVGLISPRGRERMGYPTQKPERLLERVVLASSRLGEVVLDPFCGGGTTAVVAHRLGRSWLGIDIAYGAIEATRARLRTVLGVDVATIVGAPVSVPDAGVLARSDALEFQRWALTLAGATPVVDHRGPDRGIDGRRYFHDDTDPSASTQQALFSVKSGRIGVKDVRDLRGVIERERATVGILVTLKPPTHAMRTEAANAGLWGTSAPGRRRARLQIVTVADLLTGRGLDLPPATP